MTLIIFTAFICSCNKNNIIEPNRVKEIPAFAPDSTFCCEICNTPDWVLNAYKSQFFYNTVITDDEIKFTWLAFVGHTMEDIPEYYFMRNIFSSSLTTGPWPIQFYDKNGKHITDSEQYEICKSLFNEGKFMSCRAFGLYMDYSIYLAELYKQGYITIKDIEESNADFVVAGDLPMGENNN